LRRLCLLIFALRRFFSDPINGCPVYLANRREIAKQILRRIPGLKRLTATANRPSNAMTVNRDHDQDFQH
jgi:hypothetical protein